MPVDRTIVAIDGDAAPTALVLRALGLGDLLTAVPALRGLRRGLPGHRLVLATAPTLAGLVDLIIGDDGCPVVDELLPTTGLRAPPAASSPPELAVNLHGCGPQSHLALTALTPGELLAYACDEAGVSEGPQWEPEEHEVDRWIRLVCSAGFDATRDDLQLGAAPSRIAGRVNDGAVVIHPGAAAHARRWPADRWAQVAKLLWDDGHEVVMTGSPSERPLARAVAAAGDLPLTQVVAGQTDLMALADVVARASLVLCGDTGPAHLATAFSTPSVVLFGPTPPALWGPPALNRHQVLWAGRTGDPHATHIDPGLLELTVDAVLEAARRAVAQTTV